jgi:S1-C subfamily serine protease
VRYVHLDGQPFHICRASTNSGGPSLWRACATREARALAPLPDLSEFGEPVPEAPPSERSPETPIFDDTSPIVGNASPKESPAQARLPQWVGNRPPMPRPRAVRELTPQEIFAAVSPSVYLVVAGEDLDAIKRGKGSLGSAIAVSRHWALTNCHVIGDDNPLVVLIGGEGDGASIATVARADKATDRCFLETETTLKPIAGIRQVADLAIGERVYTIGNPQGLTKTLGEGLVSGLRKQAGMKYVQTSAPISTGSSGGGSGRFERFACGGDYLPPQRRSELELCDRGRGILA